MLACDVSDLRMPGWFSRGSLDAGVNSCFPEAGCCKVRRGVAVRGIWKLHVISIMSRVFFVG